MKFPDRVYTQKEVVAARELVRKGYKHVLQVKGSRSFKQKVTRILELIETAGYTDFFRTYIMQIKEIDGLTQLRETEVEIWANKFAVSNPVDAASLLIQKANQMKEYLEGELYYGGMAEKRSVEKRIKFLEVLRKKSQDQNVIEECERLLQMWEDSALAY
jgi:hypothetical protein